MSLEKKHIFEFDRFRLDVRERTLERLDGSNNRTLPDKTFETLALLVSRHGHLVTKEDLLNKIWPDTVVEENNLDKRIHHLRKHLGEKPEGGSYIETVRGRGYRFVGNVRSVEVSGSWLAETYRPQREGRMRHLNDLRLEPVNKANGSGNIEGEAANHNGSGSIARRTEKQSFKNVLLAAGVSVIVLVTAFAGYYGFVRKSSAVAQRSIAVLPVAPITPAERNDLYVFGIAESLINQLSTADSIIVRPLSSVREHTETTKDPVVIGREQKADYVLASNYQIADGKIKITAQLYNVQSGAVESTLQTQKSAADLFAAQDAIAVDFGDRLMQRFGVSPLRSVKSRGTEDQEAYLAYVRGLILLENRTGDNDKFDEKVRTLESFDRAVSLDPNYARAWAGKSLAEGLAGFPDNDLNGEHYKQAREAIDKALALDPNESLAYTALCHLRLFYEWNYAEAEEAGRRAVELDQTSPFARAEYAAVLTSRGRANEAVDHMRKAIEMEPTSLWAQEFYANALYFARHFEEAETQYKAVLDIKPDRKATYWWLVAVMEAQGKEAEAVKWTVKLMEVRNLGDEAIQRYKAAYQRGGYREALLERANQKLSTAAALVQLGDKDAAFERLEKQYQRHFYHLAVFDIVDPLYDPLRSDPRWAELERRVRGE